jgi:hypothetical protein
MRIMLPQFATTVPTCWRQLDLGSRLDVYLPYELGHTAITFQLDQGAEMWEVADWAGTSERMIELIYRHRTSRVSRLAPLPLPDS